MAWFDILGGLAAGANKGVGQVQDDLQLRKENALKAAAEKRLIGEQKNRDAAAAREAAQEKERVYAELISRTDPTNVPEEIVRQFGPDAPSYFEKRNGTFVARMDPLKAKTRANTEAQLDDAPAALEATKLGRELTTVDARTKLAAQQSWNSPTFQRMSDNAKIQVGLAAGKDGNEIMATLKNPSVWMNRQPGLAAVNAQVAGSAAAADKQFNRYAAQNATDLEVAKIRAAGTDQNAMRQVVASIAGRLLSEDPEMDEATLTARVGAVLRIAQNGTEAGSGLSAEQTTRAAELARKYGVQ